MKKIIMRIVAVVLVLSCTAALLGCESEISVSKLPKNTEATETEARAGTENGGTQDSEELGVPGSKQLPVIAVFDLTYGQIKDLDWDSMEISDLENGTWLCECVIDTVNFTIVFENPSEDEAAKPKIMSVDDFDMCSQTFFTDDISIGMQVKDLAEEIQEQVEVMDGGFVATVILEGKNATLMFYDNNNVADAALYFVQFRRDAK